MGLMCGCDADWYPEEGDTYINGQSEFKLMGFKSYRKKCRSCRAVINANDTC